MNRWNLTGPALLLVGGLTLAAAGCGDPNLLGANQGRVRFVLSADGAASVSADEGASALPELRARAEDSVVPPSLHGEGHDGDHTDRFQSANVTFSSILARNLEGVLMNVGIAELPVKVDVVTMEGGKEVVLPAGELPAATYDQIVVVMTEVEGIESDGTTIAITPPGGGWTAIVPICPFVVEEGSTTDVGLTLKLRNAFSWRDKRYHFQPQFTCEGDDSGTSD